MNITPEKDPEESIVLEFDFSDELSVINTATITIATESGTDPAIGLILDGAHQIVGAKVFQRIKAGVDRLRYKYRCKATSGSDIRVLAVMVPIRVAN